MKKITVVMALVFLLAAPSFGQEAPGDPLMKFPGESVTLKMTNEMGRAMVQVYLGDSGPYPFFIDTGASVSVIDSAIATDLGLEKTGSMAVGAPGGNQVDSDIVAAPRIRAGDLSVDGAELIVLDIATLTHGIMHGILGLDLFREVLLTINPVEQTATVSKGMLSPDSPGVIELDTTTGRIKFDIDVGGRTVPAQIDTGSPSGFTLPLDLMDELSFAPGPEQTGQAHMVGGPRKIHSKKLDGTISFAELEYEDPKVNFLDPSPHTANLGSGLLKNLVVTIDQKNSLLRFTRLEQAPETANASSGPRRLGVRFRGSPGGGFSHVGGVEPGSLGEQAGFKDGDELISLNGKPMSEYDQASLGALLRGTEPLRWELEREGKRRIIQIN